MGVSGFGPAPQINPGEFERRLRDGVHGTGPNDAPSNLPRTTESSSRLPHPALSRRAPNALERAGTSKEAVAWFRRAIEANRNYPHQYFAMSAAFAQLGRLNEAHAAVKAGLALNPAFSICRFMCPRLRPDASAAAASMIGAGERTPGFTDSVISPRNQRQFN